MDESEGKRPHALIALGEAYEKFSAAWTPRQDFISKRRLLTLLSVSVIVASLNKALPTSIAVIGVQDLSQRYMWWLLMIAFSYSLALYGLSAVAEWRRARASDFLLREIAARISVVTQDAVAARKLPGSSQDQESRYSGFLLTSAYAKGDHAAGVAEVQRLAKVATDILSMSRIDWWIRVATFVVPPLLAAAAIAINVHTALHSDDWPPQADKHEFIPAGAAARESSPSLDNR